MRRTWMALAAAGALVVAPAGATAQTDFYNLDKDRPLRVEDAYATKRFAFELKAAPLALSQAPDRTLVYRPALELKHGLLSGLEVSAGIKPGLARPAGGDTRWTGTELELSSLLNLTTETRWLPALGLRVTGHVPLDGDGESAVEVRGLATRTLGGPVRAHLNGGWTFADGDHGRWWGGLALDYVLPFHHLLLLAETWVAESDAPLVPQPPPTQAQGTTEDRSPRIHSTAGFRYQLSPVLAMDAGVGRTWTGWPRDDWMLTLGLTYEFAVRGLIPTPRR